MLPLRTLSRHVRLPAFCNAAPFHGPNIIRTNRNLCEIRPTQRRARKLHLTRAISQPPAFPNNNDVNKSNPKSIKELPPLNENDLEETFVKGSGPGGQKINKTASTVVLKHIPSGITVRSQEHRSQIRNRNTARQILQKKLDEIERGKESLAAQELAKARARKARKRRKAVKKHYKSKADRLLQDRFDD